MNIIQVKEYLEHLPQTPRTMELLASYANGASTQVPPYIALSEAMNSHDIGRDRGGVVEALSTIKIPVVVVAIDTDRLFPPRLQEEIVEFTPTALPLVTITSPFGHDGFLIEVESVGKVLQDALAAGAARAK